MKPVDRFRLLNRPAIWMRERLYLVGHIKSDTIQSRFVNTLQDALRKAWQNKDHNTTQQIFGNFKLIGLSADFLQIWSGMIMAPIVKEMSLILEQYKSTRKFSFEQFSRFIRSFSDVSREQREYSINYFDAENFEILLQNGFLAITPMFNQFLALISSDFECIVQVYEITSSSILKLHLEFQKFVSNQTLHNFMALFVTHQKRYITMETNFLELALEKIESDFSTFSSQLLLDTAKSATDRCRVFTHWTAATSFSHCISDYFVRAVALFIRDLRSKNIIVPSQKAVSDMIYLSESDWASSYERANHLSSSVVLYQAITSFQDSVLGDLSLKVPSENVESVSSLFHLEELRKSLFSELSLNPALLEALGRLEGYVNQCQRDIVDSLVIHIKPHMEKITSIIWCESGTDTGALPKFSLSPNPFITTIGEYLLTLPQQLDALMQNENLSFRAIQLPNLITEDVQDFSGDNSQFAAEVGHLWISSIVRTVESLLISKFLAITKLSESGTKQLLTDIGYFNNILAALEIEMHSEFKLMLELLNCPADQFISTIENHKEKAIVSKIAEMRSIQI